MADINVTIENAQPINVSLGEAVNVYEGWTGDYNDLNNLPDLTLKADKTYVDTQDTALQDAINTKQPTGDYATNTALTSGLATKADTSSLAPVATSGDYTDLTNKPTIPTVPVQSVNTRTGAVTGLAEASDLTAHTSNTANPHSVTKAQVGLGSVDNTSDVNKPLSNATQSALNNKADLVAGKIPESQLPSYVDDVLSFDSLAAFPATGEDGKIYIAKDTNLTYRWSGSVYTEISPSLALGETSSTAYRGDRGKTAYDHTLLTNNPHSTTKAQVGLGNVDNTSDADKPVSTAQQTALDGKQATLVSGNNIKTINGTSMLGSGDITISGGGGGGGAIQGTGFPNGVVSASVGSKYIDTAATNGAIEWIKTSGTGNTGWNVTVGDTGWRNISSFMETALVSDGVWKVRRINNILWFAFEDIQFGNAPAGVIDRVLNSTMLPMGFRVGGIIYPGSVYALFGPSNGHARVDIISNGSLIRFGSSNNTWRLRDAKQWPTTDPWPTTLP